MVQNTIKQQNVLITLSRKPMLGILCVSTTMKHLPKKRLSLEDKF